MPDAKPKRPAKKADGEAGVQNYVARMPEPFRAMGERMHDLILTSAPSLKPKLWYGMPITRRPALCSASFGSTARS